MTYEEARREARKLFGSNAEIQHDKNALGFPFRIGVETGTPKRLVWVGMGSTWEQAFEDAKKRQVVK